MQNIAPIHRPNLVTMQRKNRDRVVPARHKLYLVQLLFA